MQLFSRDQKIHLFLFSNGNTKTRENLQTSKGISEEKNKRHDNPEENVTFTVNDKFDTASLCTILVQGSLFFTYFNNEFSSVYISFKDFKTG